VDEVSLVDNITTERTWTSTILVTLERSACGISTSKATTSGSRLSIWIRYVHKRSFAFGFCRDGEGRGNDGLRGEHDISAEKRLWRLALLRRGLGTAERARIVKDLTRNKLTTPSQLWSLVPAEKRDEYLSSSKKDVVPVLDLLPLGYSKVLGKGRIPEIPLVVRARWFSKEAERKITEAGGVVELVA
jgi:ribosomal protein L15